MYAKENQAREVDPPKRIFPDEDNQSENGRWVSEEEYWENYYEAEDSYEWNNGILEEKPVSDYEAYLMGKWFSELLEHFLRVYPIAKTMGMEMGFRMKFPKKITIRKPDIGVILNTNPVQIKGPDRSFSGIIDMCIEILSDSNRNEIERDTKVKKKEYCAGKIHEYYILDRKQRYTAFYYLDKLGKYTKIPQKDGIIRSVHLPGFQFRISDLYVRPELEQMSEDPIYKSFILPYYQQVKQQAEKEKQRAEKEKNRAEREKKRAEREKQQAEKQKKRAEEAEQRVEMLLLRLKSLGIDAEL